MLQVVQQRSLHDEMSNCIPEEFDSTAIPKLSALSAHAS